MAWSQIHARLHILLRHCLLLPKNSLLLIAVSGGQDSLCLARLLIDLQPKWQWSLAIIHCDHSWREDSAENARHVQQLAESWKIPARVVVANTAPASEAAAREWRYRVFAQVARERGCSIVVTGHTASDRAETVLYNLIRGSGVDGLSPLPWQRPIDALEPTVSLVRPLLEFRRIETGQFCQQQQLPVWEDSSNQDLRFRRNRIRQELLPYLAEHFNPRVEQALSHTAEVTAADTAYLKAQAAHLLEQMVVELDGGQAWAIDYAAFSCTPLSLRRRVAQQLLCRILAHSPNFEQVEKLSNLAGSPNGRTTDPYPGNVIAQVRKPIVWLGPVESAIADS